MTVSSSQLETGMPVRNEPNRIRITKPSATMETSRIGTCFSPKTV